jgi:hypothetical protein
MIQDTFQRLTDGRYGAAVFCLERECMTHAYRMVARRGDRTVETVVPGADLHHTTSLARFTLDEAVREAVKQLEDDSLWGDNSGHRCPECGDACCKCQVEVETFSHPHLVGEKGDCAHCDDPYDTCQACGRAMSNDNEPPCASCMPPNRALGGEDRCGVCGFPGKHEYPWKCGCEVIEAPRCTVRGCGMILCDDGTCPTCGPKPYAVFDPALTFSHNAVDVARLYYKDGTMWLERGADRQALAGLDAGENIKIAGKEYRVRGENYRVTHRANYCDENTPSAVADAKPYTFRRGVQVYCQGEED